MRSLPQLPQQRRNNCIFWGAVRKDCSLLCKGGIVSPRKHPTPYGSMPPRVRRGRCPHRPTRRRSATDAAYSLRVHRPTRRRSAADAAYPLRVHRPTRRRSAADAAYPLRVHRPTRAHLRNSSRRDVGIAPYASGQDRTAEAVISVVRRRDNKKRCLRCG